MALIFEKMEIDTWDVIEAASKTLMDRCFLSGPESGGIAYR